MVRDYFLVFTEYSERWELSNGSSSYYTLPYKS